MFSINEEARSRPPSSYFLIFLGVILLIIFLYPIKALTAVDYETGELIGLWRVKDGSSISIRYTHSVERTDVTERYIIRDNSLVLMEEHFSSFGAGLPADNTYPFKVTEDGFLIYDINKTISELIYRTGAIRANHVLIVNNSEISFTEFSVPRQAVLFGIENTFLFKYLIRGGGVFER